MKRVLVVILSIFMLFSLRVSAYSDVSVSAKAAILINGTTGSVLFAKNADQQLAMASTTKIMSALLLCEAGHPDKEILVTREMVAVEGSSMGLKPGITVCRRDLLFGMLLPSGNDAANVAAYSVAGSVPAFVALMNRRASEMGLINTHFATPSGLDADNHYTTASDLAKITRIALQNESFREACSSKYVTLYFGDPETPHTLSNHNRLLKTYPGMIGVKTGFTKKAGRCLVTAAERDGALLIAVTLSAPNDWQDHTSMLNYGFSIIENIDLAANSKPFSIPVVGGKSDSVIASAQECFVWISKREKDNFKTEVYLPRFVYSPVCDRMVIGAIKYKIGDNIIAETPVIIRGEVAPQISDNIFLKEWIRNVILLLKGL